MDRLAGSAKLLRAMNESAALGHLLKNGTLTRNDLREITGLSKPTTGLHRDSGRAGARLGRGGTVRPLDALVGDSVVSYLSRGGVEPGHRSDHVGYHPSDHR